MELALFYLLCVKEPGAPDSTGDAEGSSVGEGSVIREIALLLHDDLLPEFKNRPRALALTLEEWRRYNMVRRTDRLFSVHQDMSDVRFKLIY